MNFCNSLNRSPETSTGGKCDLESKQDAILLMASGNTYSDDMWSKSEVIDPPQSEDMMEVNEHCSNDHTWCSRCKSRVHNRCLTCMHELGNIRCLVLERIVTSLELPCKYQSFGCLGTYPNYNKLKHESHNIPYLVTHLKDDRKIDTHNGSTFNHCYVKSNPHEVFSFLGQYFYYIASLRFMGDDNEAKSCSYSLEVKGTGRKMIWQGVPRGIRDNHRKGRNQATTISSGSRSKTNIGIATQ
ncbi:hypothetical protein AAG906_022292 [Vitis piasezkii]